MCGITGFFSYKNKVDSKKYYESHLKIAHRGPDDEGFIYKNENNQIEHLKGNDTIDALRDRVHILGKEPSNLILGHRRLSIIDLTSNGHQPYNFDDLYMVYNGEVYNYVELKKELEAFGYKFTTNSDTEVVLKAFHKWGVDAFNKFNGMWAIAIYDKKKDELLLCRDRFGIKPFYYSFIDDNLIFGSEIKFVASFFNNLYPNKQRVYDYLRFNYINHTNETLFKNIFQLEPNSYMFFSKMGIKTSKYWSLKECDEDVESNLVSSIKFRLRSDVEVGSLLSGGIDSSTILGLIDDKNMVKNFQTFSAVFREEIFSEKKYIDKFDTKNIKLKKHFIYPKAEELKDMIEELIYTQEEPFRSLAVFSQYNIYKYIKDNTKVKVLLNGQGADEIFTGYTEYYYVYLLELLRNMDIKTFLQELKAFSENRDISKVNVIKKVIIQYLSNIYRKPDKYGIFKIKFKPFRNRKIFKDLLKNSLWNSLTVSALREYLIYEDKNSMRFSLESRLPFLDFRVVESGFSLSNDQKIKNGVSKAVLRKIAKGKIPEEILNRKDKMGFLSPQEKWQKDILSQEFDRVFNEIKENGIFDFLDNKRLYELYINYKNNKLHDWPFIWRVYSLYQWKKVWDVK